MDDRIILPGEASDDPDVVIEEVKDIEIKDTDLADTHLPKHAMHKQLDKGAEDWGDGFRVYDEPVLITRDRDGSIIKTTPLSEIPGVSWADDEPEEAQAKVTPKVLPRKDRERLVGILATRLFRYYETRGPLDPRYNPFRDGIPENPQKGLQLTPDERGLYQASNQEIYDWLIRVVAERVKIVNKNRFGGNTLQDLALRIE